MNSSSVNMGGNSRKEQWCAIKFCVKLGKSAMETFELLQNAYSTNSLKKPTVFDWHRRFVEMRHHQSESSGSSANPRGSVSIQEDPENLSDDASREERPTTVRELTEVLHGSQGSAREFASVKVGMSTVGPRLQPKMVNLDDNYPEESIYSNPIRNYNVTNSNLSPGKFPTFFVVNQKL